MARNLAELAGSIAMFTALSKAIFAEVNAYLTENGLTLRSGTLVDATIIDAPSSTKNKAGKLPPVDAHINRLIARVRVRVEHPFRVLKRQFGYIKTRYRGLARNRALLFSLFALGNLYLVRRRLMA